jgi:tetratricopeptide (TPR) repeat protein
MKTGKLMEMTGNNTEQQHDSTQHYELLQELGDCYAVVGNFVQAQQCYDKAANLCPDEPGPYVGMGVVSLQQNHLDDAETAFRVACRLGPKCSKAYLGLGMVEQQRADYRKAFDMFLKCLELDSNNLVGLLGLFQVSCQMGSFEKVTYYLKSYLNMHPGDISVMYPLAALYMRDGRLEESKLFLRNILALDDKHKDAISLLEEVEHKLACEQQTGVVV